jgi:hypothetical protein
MKVKRTNIWTSKAASFACVLLGVNCALAHPETRPEAVDGYCKVVLLPEGARVIYTVLVGDEPALAERRAADTDGDGRLSAAEQAALARRWSSEVSRGLSLTFDGAAITPTYTPEIGLAGDTIAASSFSVDVTAQLASRVGPHTLIVEDRIALPAGSEHDLYVEDSPGVTLTRKSPRIEWQPKTPPPEARSGRLVLVAVVVVVLVVGVMLLRRRYRNMNG